MGGTVVGHEGSAHFQNWRSHDGIGLIFRRYVPGILHHQKVRARGGEQTIYEQARVYFHHNAPALTIPFSSNLSLILQFFLFRTEILRDFQSQADLDNDEATY